MKTITAVALSSIALVAGATDYQVKDLESFDLSGEANAVGNRLVFTSEGTSLTLTGAGEGETKLWAEIVSADEGVNAALAIEGAAGKSLRLANHVTVKGSLGITGFDAVSVGTNLTVATIDSLKSDFPRLPALNVAALADGTALTIDGATALVKAPSSGVTVDSTALLAIAGEDALGRMIPSCKDVAEGKTVYTFGDYDVALVATNSFVRHSKLKVAAGRTLGMFPATVDETTYAFTQVDTKQEESHANSICHDIELSGADEDGRNSTLSYWAGMSVTYNGDKKVETKYNQRLRGSITGNGDVKINRVADSTNWSYYEFYGKHSFKGTVTANKCNGLGLTVGGGSFGDPSNKLTFGVNTQLQAWGPDDTNCGTNEFYIGEVYSGYYSFTLYVAKNQCATIGKLTTGTGGGINVSGVSMDTSTLHVMTNAMKDGCVLRIQNATLQEDDDSRSGVYFVDKTNRRWYIMYTSGQTYSNCIEYKGWSGALNGVVLDHGTATFKTFGKDTYLNVCTNASCTAYLDASDVTVNVASGATIDLHGVIGTTTLNATGATVNVPDPVTNLTVNAAGGTVNVDKGGEYCIVNASEGAMVNALDAETKVSVALADATLDYPQDATSWTNDVALWVDASKVETLGALTNKNGVAQYQNYSKDLGTSTTQCVARAWWYDWRDRNEHRYYLYNNRSYKDGADAVVPYVNPWWQPEGGPNNGPCVCFGPLASSNARLNLHNFELAVTTETSIPAKYVYLVYGALDHDKARGGSPLFRSTGNRYLRSIDSTSGSATDPIVSNMTAVVRHDGKETLGYVESMKVGWQIIGIDTRWSDNTYNSFWGLNYYDGKTYCGGQMYAEVLVFTNAPTSLQKYDIERYLAKKWGLESQYVGTKTFIKPALNGNGTLSVGTKAPLDLSNAGGFRGTVEMDGGDLKLSAAKVVPEAGDIPTDGQIGWFDPSMEHLVVKTDIPQTALEWLTPLHAEQTNEFCYLYDRVKSRRTHDKDLVLASEANRGNTFGNFSRRMYVDHVAYGFGEKMNWLDANSPYTEYKITGGVTNATHYGNGMRFWKKKNTEQQLSNSDMTMNMQTAFIVQNSMRGGGTPIADKFGLWAPTPFGRETSDPKAPLWKAGASNELVNGGVYVNGSKVEDPLKSAEFTGGPEVLRIQTSGGTFPLKAMGDFYNSDGNAKNGEIFGEVLLYGKDSTLTDAQTADIEAYLASKWFGKTMGGYVAPQGITIVGGTTITADSVRHIPQVDEDFDGTITVSGGDIAFVVSGDIPGENKVTSGYFSAPRGTLALPQNVTVSVRVDERMSAGTYRLADWNALADGTTFTLESATGLVKGQTAELNVTGNGLDLVITGPGMILFMR